MKKNPKKPKLENETPEEQVLFTSLRASDWDEFFGQENIKKSLKIGISAAKKRKEPIEHILLYGPPGLGKTTISHLIAREMNVNIRITSGPAIERAGDLASILTNLEKGEAKVMMKKIRVLPVRVRGESIRDSCIKSKAFHNASPESA